MVMLRELVSCSFHCHMLCLDQRLRRDLFVTYRDHRALHRASAAAPRSLARSRIAMVGAPTSAILAPALLSTGLAELTRKSLRVWPRCRRSIAVGLPLLSLIAPDCPNEMLCS